MGAFDKIKKLLGVNSKSTNTEAASKSPTEAASKSNDSQKTYWNNWNKHSWWISLPIFSLLSIIIIWLLSNVSFDSCQQVGYNIKQTQTLMSLTPIEIDRAKYAVGQIVHISHFQNNSDTKNVKEYPEYSVGHIVNISQIANDSTRENVKEYLEINRTHYPSPSIILRYPFIILGCYEPFTPKEQDTFALIELDNLRSNYTFIPNQPGLYVISTYSTNSTYNHLQEEQQKEFKTIFEVINPIKSATFTMLIIAVGFFIALVFLTFILSIKNKILNNEKIRELKNSDYTIESIYTECFPIIKKETERKKIEEKYQRILYDYIEIAGSIRFLFISALVWSIILALVLTEVEIGTQSPLGLVLRHNLNPEGGELDVTKNPLIEWGINIGGNWENNFSSGVVIPFYVLILGFVGGYLRYLQKATSKEKIEEKSIKGTSTESKETKYKPPTESTSLEFQQTTYGELSNIFLAPLLAAVVWFIISQGQTDFNIYGMAAISFSIGLVTKEIIQIIVKFMERIIPPEK